ncbi:bifunctional folylpolyglutamate synthase/dihydrofolate synthase [Deinococcus sp. KNUC1210]|uniref:glutamate ligase domain-containing protein n=1 Tax=Deinococcus sp. KNUC1210 TaxID=2917691 RepID=UPI001EF0BE87|nr:cyanophycin synthetase [Deinococcus sp. KNUC1210]ULH16701.1 bifunctional folylpolyglutamate synthase/dihydrofolate synthase [Deinococcus sp. KNUC1210]
MNEYEWLYARTRQGRERGPAPARALLDALGTPDARFGSLRVVGTNGKGSVCAMLEAGLLAADIRTGRFTSPHLTHFEERVRVNGREISAAQTAEFVAWAQQHAPEAAFFDLSLGLAAQVFAASGVQTAIMEAGVGGVSDATQALRNVRALLLTNVALDHTATLGPTTAQIARDKASAALPGVPLLTTATAEALEVVAQVAHDHGAPLYTPHSHPALFALPHLPTLSGPHQETNARLALAALRLLGSEQASSERVLDAALKASWPARLERFAVQGRSVLLDGAHNPAAAAALALAVPHADVLLFGSLARKDSAATLNALKSVAAVRVFTHPAPPVAGEPQADLQVLADLYGGLITEDARVAFRQALSLTPAGGTLLVAGSLYLAGTLRPLLLAMRDASPTD